MAEEKKVVIRVSDWLRVYDDGSVDRTFGGPPEFTFLLQPVPSHEEFIEGIATRDVIIDKATGHRVRIYLPERKPEETDKLPVILHFHGGGFCFCEADWYMYYYIYSKIARAARANAVVVSLKGPALPMGGQGDGSS